MSRETAQRCFAHFIKKKGNHFDRIGISMKLRMSELSIYILYSVYDVNNTVLKKTSRFLRFYSKYM